VRAFKCECAEAGSDRPEHVQRWLAVTAQWQIVDKPPTLACWCEYFMSFFAKPLRNDCGPSSSLVFGSARAQEQASLLRTSVPEQ